MYKLTLMQQFWVCLNFSSLRIYLQVLTSPPYLWTLSEFRILPIVLRCYWVFFLYIAYIGHLTWITGYSSLDVSFLSKKCKSGSPGRCEIFQFWTMPENMNKFPIDYLSKLLNLFLFNSCELEMHFHMIGLRAYWRICNMTVILMVWMYQFSEVGIRHEWQSYSSLFFWPEWPWSALVVAF